jgi:Outer membrane protein
MKYLFLFLLSVTTVNAFSQEKTWTLTECMRYAVENSPKRNKQAAQNEIYKQNYLESIGGLVPSVRGNTNASFNFGRGLDYETNTYINTNSFSNSYSIYSSVTLFDGLSGISRMKMQKINRLMGKDQLKQTEDLLAYETMEVFLNVVYYRGTVELAQEQLEESEATLKQVTRMQELGLKAAPDVTEIRAKEAADRYQLTQQKNLYELELIRLKEKMNFPIDESLTVTESIESLLVSEEAENASDIFHKAMDYLPQIRASQHALKASKMGYRAAKGNLYPSIAMEGGYSTGFSRLMDGSKYEPFKDQLKNRRGHYVAFSLNIPIFSGFSRSAEVKRSKQRMIIAANEYDETLRTVHSEIQQAVADMKGQSDQYVQAVRQTEAMEEAHRVNQRKYTEGLISMIELSTSSNRLLQAKVEKLNAELKYQLKYKLVEYYKGNGFF